MVSSNGQFTTLELNITGPVTGGKGGQGGSGDGGTFTSPDGTLNVDFIRGGGGGAGGFGLTVESPNSAAIICNSGTITGGDGGAGGAAKWGGSATDTYATLQHGGDGGDGGIGNVLD
jgi:hypothetical protein